jgi:hypothetical protein
MTPEPSGAVADSSRNLTSFVGNDFPRIAPSRWETSSEVVSQRETQPPPNVENEVGGNIVLHFGNKLITHELLGFRRVRIDPGGKLGMRLCESLRQLAVPLQKLGA